MVSLLLVFVRCNTCLFRSLPSYLKVVSLSTAWGRSGSLQLGPNHNMKKSGYYTLHLYGHFTVQAALDSALWILFVSLDNGAGF